MNRSPDADPRSSDPTAADAAPATPAQRWPHVTGRRILLGVTGGIAAYKAAEITSRLAQAGALVTVAMTESATRFVAPLTFQALSGHPVYDSPWQRVESADPQHIGLARRLDLALVAPCTMHAMARLALGLADDVVSLILSAVDRHRQPVLLAPAMNAIMWAQPATQRHRRTLVEDGYGFIGPDTGWQACRTEGAGRMAEPTAILDAVDAEIGRISGSSSDRRTAATPPPDAR